MRTSQMYHVCNRDENQTHETVQHGATASNLAKSGALDGRRLWHEPCSTAGMRLSTVLLSGLALACACSAEEIPGGGTQRPQPEPELERFVAIDPALVRVERTATGLLVRGEPRAVTANDEQVVVTELRPGAPVSQVEVDADRSFAAALTTTGATQVQMTPVYEDTIGPSLIFAVDAAGGLTQLAPPCLSGASGVWQMGNVSDGTAALALDLYLVNQCDGPVTIDAFTTRLGTEFSVGPVSLPRTLAPRQNLQVPVQFTRAAGEPARGAPRYDFVDVSASPADAGRGFVVRVTREPTTQP